MRTTVCFDNGWAFHRGNIEEDIPVLKDLTYPRTKTGFKEWMHSPSYSIRNWKKLSLPHDFVIGDTPDPSVDNATGYLRGETSWYRKVFTLDEADFDKRITLHFEGIAIHSEIFVNGTLIARNFSAYNPIDVDITDFVIFGEKKNVVAVHCIIPNVPEGWWYQGGGIYRHVWLTKTEKLSVDLWGVYAKPEKLEDGTWKLSLETTLRNDSLSEKQAEILSEIIDANGNVVASVKSSTAVSPFSKSVSKSVTSLSSPALWSCEEPNMYSVKTTVFENGKEIDLVETPFGFREIYFDPDKGFFLNGKHTKIKGVCCHQDYGLTGIVLPDSIAEYRLQLLKDMGANGYRSAHNLSDNATMNACDRLGLLVFDETRYFESSAEGLRMMEQMVLRDRNHPSVICWSVGNEEPEMNTESGKRIATRMSAKLKELDNTRPVTLACCGNDATLTPEASYIALESLDLVSYNYNLKLHEELHAAYPDKPFVLTETCALQTSRGHYFANDYAKGLFSAYDDVISRKDFNCNTRSETWNHIMSHDFIAGGFVWAGIEHRGETLWPRLCSASGLLDLYLLKKDAYYQTKAQYTSEPMVHIVPASWNFEGLEGQNIRVVLYTNCEETELFLNGVSLGRKKTPANYENAEWSVPFEKGCITAVAYNNGIEVCRDEQITSQKAYKLNISLENKPVKIGDTAVFHCYCTDENGLYVPDASPFVSFTVGGGTLLGTGSDKTDHVPPKCSDRKMRMGLIAIAVEVTSDEVCLIAESDGLKKACYKLNV